MPWLRERTNEFTSRVISGLAGTPIPDSQNGYRLFDAAVLKAVRNLESDRYDLESEILIKAAALGFRVVSVPGHHRVRRRDQFDPPRGRHHPISAWCRGPAAGSAIRASATRAS